MRKVMARGVRTARAMHAGYRVYCAKGAERDSEE
jgi:hypothetical protein